VKFSHSLLIHPFVARRVQGGGFRSRVQEGSGGGYKEGARTMVQECSGVGIRIRVQEYGSGVGFRSRVQGAAVWPNHGSLDFFKSKHIIVNNLT
jgi:hypothetical protein